MNKTNVILIHGKDTDPTKKWYPWLSNEMKDRGIKCSIPKLPRPDNPVLSEWLSEIDKLKPNKESVLVGHSRGGIAILRWLEQQPQNEKVKKVILIATSNPSIHRKNQNVNSHGFYEEGPYDFNKIKSHCNKFVVLHSKDDRTVEFASGRMNAQKLDAKFLVFENLGHFGSKLPKPEIPELLDEILS
jgi:hypothetical protein